MKKGFSLHLRVTSLVVLSVFSFSEIAHAAEGLSFGAGFKNPVAVIPADAATIDFEVTFPGRRKIWLVRDAHTNESGQLNIAKTLAALQTARAIQTVFLEGADGDVSLEIFKKGVPAGRRERVGLAYLKKGWLQGAEYWNLLSADRGVLWGVEDPELYDEALRLYAESATRRDDASRSLGKIERTVAMLKTRIYSSKLREFDAARERFAKGEEGLAGYAARLFGLAREAGLGAKETAQTRRLMRLGRLERGIDFASADRQMRAAILSLSDEEREVFEKTDARATFARFRAGDADDPTASLHALLESRLTGDARFPELRKYWKYLREAGRLDAKALSEEITRIESRSGEALAKSDDEKKLLNISHRVRILRDVLAMRASASDFASVRATPQLFSSFEIGATLNRLILDLGAGHENAVFYDARLDESAQMAARFYELTYERDRAFVERIAQKMDQTGEAEAALVAGGYHSENLQKLFAERSISYAVITPRVLHATDERRYEKLLLEDLKSARAGAPHTARADGVSVRPMMAGSRAPGQKRDRAIRFGEDLEIPKQALDQAMGPDPAGAGATEKDLLAGLDQTLEAIDDILEGRTAPPAGRRYSHKLEGGHVLTVVDAVTGETVVSVAENERDFETATEILVYGDASPTVVVRWRGVTRIYDTAAGTMREHYRPSWITQILEVGVSVFVLSLIAGWLRLPPRVRRVVAIGLLAVGGIGVIGVAGNWVWDGVQNYRASVAAAQAEKRAVEAKLVLEKTKAKEQAAALEAERAAEEAAEKERLAAVEAARKKTEVDREFDAKKKLLLAELEELRAKRRGAIEKLENSGRSTTILGADGEIMTVPVLTEIRLGANLTDSERVAAAEQVGEIADDDFVYREGFGSEARYYRIASWGAADAGRIDLGSALQITSKRLSRERDKAIAVEAEARDRVNRITDGTNKEWSERDIPAFQHSYGMDQVTRKPITEVQGLGRWSHYSDGTMGLQSRGYFKFIPGVLAGQAYWKQVLSEYTPTKEEIRVAEEWRDALKRNVAETAEQAQADIRSAETRIAQISEEMQAADPMLAEDIRSQQNAADGIEAKVAAVEKNRAEQQLDADAKEKIYEELTDGYGVAIRPDGTPRPIQTNADALRLRFVGELLPEERKAYEAVHGPTPALTVVFSEPDGQETRQLPVRHLTPAGAEFVEANHPALQRWTDWHAAAGKKVMDRHAQAQKERRKHERASREILEKAYQAERTADQTKKSEDKARARALRAEAEAARRKSEPHSNLESALEWHGLIFTDGGKNWRRMDVTREEGCPTLTLGT